MHKDEIVNKLVSLQTELQREGVAHLAIFGSRASGDNSDLSDIDLLVDTTPMRKFSILNLIGVEHLVLDSIGVTANAFMRRNLDDEFRKSIHEDVIQVF
jgi:uncharacterized protein